MLFLIGLNWPAFHSCIKRVKDRVKKQEKSSFLVCQYSQSGAAGMAKTEISEQVKVPSAIPQTLPHVLKPNTNPTDCHKEIAKETSGPNSCGWGRWRRAFSCIPQAQMWRAKSSGLGPVPWVLSLPSSSLTKQFWEGGKGSLIYIFYIQPIWRLVCVWNKDTICPAPNTAAAWSNLSLPCSGPFGQEANIQLIPCAGWNLHFYLKDDNETNNQAVKVTGPAGRRCSAWWCDWHSRCWCCAKLLIQIGQWNWEFGFSVFGLLVCCLSSQIPV